MRPWVLKGLLCVLVLTPAVGSAESQSSLDSARGHLDRGNYGAALKEARELLYDDPRNGAALYVAGVAALNLDRLNDAEKFLERAKRVAPDAPELEYQLGVVLLRMADNFFERGKDKIGLGLCNDALQHFENELQRSPDHSEAISLRAAAYLKSGRVVEATRAYEKWIETDPDNPDVYVELVRLYTVQDNIDGARELLSRFPGDPTEDLAEAIYLVARADYVDGRAAEGRALLEQLQSLPTEPWQVPGLEALDSVIRGDGHDAAASLLEFLDRGPPDDEVEIIATAYHEKYRELRRAAQEAAGGDTLPKLDMRVSHIYPLDADRYGVEGDILLLVVVEVDGSIGEQSVISSKVSRHASLYRSAFEDAATKAVGQWRYLPARRDGQPVAFPITVNIRFSQ